MRKLCCHQYHNQSSVRMATNDIKPSPLQLKGKCLVWAINNGYDGGSRCVNGDIFILFCAFSHISFASSADHYPRLYHLWGTWNNKSHFLQDRFISSSQCGSGCHFQSSKKCPEIFLWIKNNATLGTSHFSYDSMSYSGGRVVKKIQVYNKQV